MKTSVEEYKTILGDLERRLESVETERNELMAAVTAIRKIVARERDGAPTRDSTEVEVGPNRYRNMSLAKAAADYLKLVGRPLKTGQIRDALLLGGFQTKAKNVYNSVHSTLSGAKGFVNRNGKWEYTTNGPDDSVLELD